MSHAASSWIAPRRKSRPIRVGSVTIGGDAPIAVQSMTNTDTRDIDATRRQIQELADAGADLVRISCPDQASAEAVGPLCQASPVPLIADIHFDHRLALMALEQGIHGLRINPGNIGSKARVQEVVEAARARNVSIRIGVNAGSLERALLERYREPCPEAMVASALHHIRILEDLDFHEIKISLKASSVAMTVAAYRLLAEQVDYPLHLGITEAGGLIPGSVKSAVGLGLLLAEGIGDTLRVSLTADPTEEIRVGFEILKSLGLRSRGINIISCPTCARQEFQVIDVVSQLEARLAHIRHPISLSVIGCVVNGPGEAKESHLGVVGGSGPNQNLIYRNGQSAHKVSDAEMVEALVHEVERISAHMDEERHVQREVNELSAIMEQESDGVTEPS